MKVPWIKISEKKTNWTSFQLSFDGLLNGRELENAFKMNLNGFIVDGHEHNGEHSEVRVNMKVIWK